MKKRSRRTRPRHDPAYLAFIRKLPCVVTGAYPAEASHLRSLKHGSGVGLKTPDATAIPMSRAVHADYETRTGMFRGWTQEQRETWHMKHAEAYRSLYDNWSERGRL